MSNRVAASSATTPLNRSAAQPLPLPPSPVRQSSLESLRDRADKRSKQSLATIPANSGNATDQHRRRQLLEGMIKRHALDPAFIDQLKSDYPNDSISTIADAIRPVVAEKTNTQGPRHPDVSIPRLDDVYRRLSAQAKNSSAWNRIYSAVDVLARLLHPDRAQAIEQGIQEMLPAARRLAVAVRPEEYAVIRQELLSLPLGSRNRVYLIRELAIKLNRTLPDGDNFRQTIHNNSSPRDVQMTHDRLPFMVKADSQDKRPSALEIATLMEAYQALKEGQSDDAKAILGTAAAPFAHYPKAAKLDEVVAHIDQRDTALAAFKEFVDSITYSSQDQVPAEYKACRYDAERTDCLNDLAYIYRELKALYEPEQSAQALLDSFPYGAPLELQEQVFRLNRALEKGDELAALVALSNARSSIYRLAVTRDLDPTAPVRQLAKTLSGKLGPYDFSFPLVAEGVEERSPDAAKRMDAFLRSYMMPSDGTCSTAQIKVLDSLGIHSNEMKRVLEELVTAVLDNDAKAATLALRLQTGFRGASNINSDLESLIRYAQRGERTRAWYSVCEMQRRNYIEATLNPGVLSDVIPSLAKDGPRKVAAEPAKKLQEFLTACRDNDRNTARSRAQELGNLLSGHPAYETLQYATRHVGNGYDPRLAVPFIEDFVIACQPIDTNTIRRSLAAQCQIDDAQTAEDLMRLYDMVMQNQHMNQCSALDLIRLDGLLQELSMGLFANAASELGAIDSNEKIPPALFLLRGFLQAAIATGFDDLLEVNPKRLDLMDVEDEAQKPTFRALLADTEALLSLDELTEAHVAQIETLARNAVDRVVERYQDLLTIMGGRIHEIEQSDSQFGMPNYVDSMFKQTPLGHMQALCDNLAAWCSRATAPVVQKVVPGGLVNPAGGTPIFNGRVLLKRVVTAKDVASIPSDAVIDHQTLLVLDRIGAENIAMAGGILVGRADDGSGAGGQLSHIFMWARNMSVPGATFPNAKAQAEAALSTLKDGEDIYLEVRGNGFALAPASVALANGWFRQEERAQLTAGVNTVVTFEEPGRSVGMVEDLETLHHVKRRALGRTLRITIPRALQQLSGVGAQPMTFEQLAALGAPRKQGECLVGPKASVLAGFTTVNDLKSHIEGGLGFTFAAVSDLLRKSGTTQAMLDIEPALGDNADNFWASDFMTDPVARKETSLALQQACREGLAAALLEDGEPTELAEQMILTPLKQCSELVGPDGQLLPIILRSSSNAEDVLNFNAAGKHESVPNLLNEADIVQGFIEVVASLWSPGAVENRQYFGVDSRLSAMSVLAMRSMDPEISGVLITCDEKEGQAGVFRYQANRGLFGGVDGDAQIQVAMLGSKADERLVETEWNAKTIVRPDTVNGGVKEVKATADLQPGQAASAGRLANLLTAAQEETLYRAAAAARKYFNTELYPGQNVEVDLEFLIEKGKLYVVQARPFPTE